MSADLTPIVTQVRQQLDECQAVVDDAVATIKLAIAQCAIPCAVSVEVCRGCIRAEINKTADLAAKLVGKCRERIQRQIVSTLEDAYIHTQSMLGPPPEIEQVVAELLAGTAPAAPPAVVVDQPAPPPRPPSIGPPIDCPPGFHPHYDDATGLWRCDVICGPGMILSEDGQSCLPAGTPPPGPTCGIDTENTVPINPPPPPKPHCPKPTEQCKEGYDWWWDADLQKWKCTPGGLDPVLWNPDLNASCGAPVDFNCPTSGPSDIETTLAPDWNKGDVCNQIEQSISTSSSKSQTIATSLPWYWDDKNDAPVMPAYVSTSMKSWPSWVQKLVFYVVAFLVMPVDIAIKQLPAVAGCDWRKIFSTWMVKSLLDFLERWTAIELPGFRASAAKVINRQCPTEIPGQGELNALYYTRQIDASVWTCFTRANGNLDHWQEKVRDIGIPTPGPGDLIQMVRRGTIAYDDFRREIKDRYGFDEKWVDPMFSLTANIPGPSDLVSFMVRDSADEAVVKQYGFDEGFDDKFTGPLLDWAKQQGVDEQTMRFNWRAHWTLPSNFELYQMLHRLRGDSIDPQARANAVDFDAIVKAMEVNDIPKFWRDKLAAISYLPLTRTDLKTAYFNDSINEADLLDGLQNTGLSKRDAQLLMKSMIQDKTLSLQRRASALTPNRVAALYKGFGITNDEAIDFFQQAGLTASQAQAATKFIDKEIQATRRVRLVQMVKRRYMIGDLSQLQAQQLLLKIPVDARSADDMVQDWETEIDVRSKQVAAAQLCTWRYRSLITEAEQRIRLRRIGYQPADIDRIVADCNASIPERMLDRAAKTAKDNKALDQGKKKQGAAN